MTKRAKCGTSKEAAKERRAHFVEAYIANGGNAAEAARTVGYAPRSAYTTGSALTKDPEIARMIAERKSQLMRANQLTVDRWWQEVSRLSTFNPKKLVDENGKLKPLHELDDDTAAALGAIEVEIGQDQTVLTRVRPHSKTTALDMAAKVLRVYDAPPPPPPDTEGNQPVDRAELAKWLAFALARGTKGLPKPT